MVAAVRKPAAAVTAPPVVAGVNFGDLGMYAGGFSIPEGKYVWADVTAQMYQAEDLNGIKKGPARLGVMITLQNMAEPAAEMRTQFYSMGTSAHLSFQPNPENGGKSLVAIPGGPAGGFNSSTNWAVLLQSLYNCALPAGVFTNDLTVLEGLHAHMQPVAEPKERAGFKSNTAEVQEERKPQNILVVTEILEGGAPWEGGGGLIAGAAVPAAPAAQTTKAAGKPNGAVRPVAAAAAAAEVTEDDIMSAASDAVTTILSEPANQEKCPKLVLRTNTFKVVRAAHGDDLATAVINTFFGDDVALNTVLNPLGYQAKGAMVTPKA